MKKAVIGTVAFVVLALGGLFCLRMWYDAPASASAECLTGRLYWCYDLEETASGRAIHGPAICSIALDTRSLNALPSAGYLIESDVESGVCIALPDTSSGKENIRWDILHVHGDAISPIMEDIHMQDCLRILAYKGGSVYFVKAGDAPDVDYVYARMEQNGHVLEYPIEVNGDFIVDDASGLENYASSYSATVSDRGRIAYDDLVRGEDGEDQHIVCYAAPEGAYTIGEGESPTWIGDDKLVFDRDGMLFCYDISDSEAYPCVTASGECIELPLKVPHKGMSANKAGTFLAYFQYTSKSERIVVVSLETGLHYPIEEIPAVPLFRDRDAILWG